VIFDVAVVRFERSQPTLVDQAVISAAIDIADGVFAAAAGDNLADQLEIFILHGAPNLASSLLLLSGHFPSSFSHAVTRLALYSRSVANRSAVSLPEKCLTGMPFRLTVHQV
jgi:hypothetical protein